MGIGVPLTPPILQPSSYGKHHNTELLLKKIVVLDHSSYSLFVITPTLAGLFLRLLLGLLPWAVPLLQALRKLGVLFKAASSFHKFLVG